MKKVFLVSLLLSPVAIFAQSNNNEVNVHYISLWMPLLLASVPAICGVITTLLSNHFTRKDIRLDLLRLQILSKELPLDDRLKCYDTYKKLGGNSWLSTYVSTVLIPQASTQAQIQAHGQGFVFKRRKEDQEVAK